MTTPIPCAEGVASSHSGALRQLAFFHLQSLFALRDQPAEVSRREAQYFNRAEVGFGCVHLPSHYLNKLGVI
jgi:hypothetical protein